MEKRPYILVTNDDGISAPGIRHLVKLMNQLGEVVVVAPDSPQSGKGHAVTISSTLSLEEVHLEGPQKDFSCSGTPVDCVKIAQKEVLDRRPDLVVSGINHGSNASINILYSGTMSAAVEAGIEGIPAVGFSLLDYSYDADFTQASDFILNIVKEILDHGLPTHTVLNVNIPNLKREKIKGVRVCRQGKAHWEEYFDKRRSPYGKTYFWLAGEFVNDDLGLDSDIHALEEGYISVVPVQMDLTDYRHMPELAKRLDQKTPGE